MVSTSEIVLEPEQQAAVDAAVSFLRDQISNKLRGVLRIGGYAGTGKTTIAKVIMDEVSRGSACAFTGKAASVLRSKGIPASTIHKLIYRYSRSQDRFILHDSLPCQWVLLDEGSMISTKLWADLKSFDLPMLVLGDPGQLEPVGADPGLMIDPDIVLEKIHRQAEQSPIIRLATEIRSGQEISCREEGGLLVADDETPFWEAIGWADQFICGTNKTRVKVNDLVRKHLGHKKPIEENERVIVLCNDPDLGIWNGQIFTVTQVVDEGPDETIAIVADAEGEEKELTLLHSFLRRKKGPSFRNALYFRGEIAIVAYGYCTTCHKSQGSEWDKVAVLGELSDKWDQARWSYTAVTRAAKGLRYSVVK